MPAVIYARLWNLNFNPKGSIGHTHRNFKQGNYRIIFEFYNITLSSLVKDGLDGGLSMTGGCAIEAKKLCGRRFVEVLRIFTFE